MKKAMIFFVAMMIAFGVFSQEMVIEAVETGGGGGPKIMAGAKFGPVFKNLYGSDVDDNKMGMGFLFGVHGTYQISDLISAQVELNYEGKGTKFKYSGETTKLRLGYFTIPFMARGDFEVMDKLNVFANTGFFVGFLMGVRVDGDKEVTYQDYIYDPNNPFAPPTVVTKTEKYKDNFKTIDFGWLIGGGASYEIMENLRVFSDLRVNLGFVNIPDADKDNKMKTFSFVWGFGAAYALPF
ncbi:MAG: PorT family protein [Bacteroidetes bacterium]|nr:PorT family protein [Bacteroidota bacterium]